MPKLEGIIYKTFDHYVVLRGFAPIKDLAAISHKPEAYQRPAISKHKKEIIQFLNTGEYKYFPEITLACRVNKYSEFSANIGIDNAVDRDDAQYVQGLRVLAERLPYDSYRARHAYLTKNDSVDLVRVDGNHRLESFDDPNDPVWKDAGVKKSEIEKIVVPFTVIFSEQEFGDKFEAGIFHNVNFRQEPLRQEASLKIISDLNVFEDKEKLGNEYPLTINLIERVKSGMFSGIPWLAVDADISTTYFRTSCLRISQLLLTRKNIIENLWFEVNEAIKTNKNKIDKLSTDIEKLKRSIDECKQKRNELEITNHDFEKFSEHKKYVKEIERMQLEIEIAENSLYQLQSEGKHLGYKAERYLNYTSSCESPTKIIEALNSLQKTYEEFEDGQYGNIAMLVAMVYYFLIDKAQLNSFISWAKQNGVNKIIDADDLSIDASANLIEMFEQIFQSKKNEIFISMQFGDSQSELIYEKIVRAIEMFNQKHKSIHLSARPIRIDRTIESSTYSIQDKILDAIQSCSLIVADLSSSNINVYHEIGYAMGVAQSNKLLPNMILLYKENTDHNKNSADIDKFVGFNLRNLSQLRFRDYKQLIDGLVERLEKHYGV